MPGQAQVLRGQQSLLRDHNDPQGGSVNFACVVRSRGCVVGSEQKEKSSTRLCADGKGLGTLVGSDMD